RQVARLRINGEDVNFAQIQNGHAWHYQSIAKRNQPEDDFARYDSAQAEAKKQRKGLWRERSPLAPWDYRKEKRAGKQPE
ncbi:thermonuclease family protein, partial [Conchiformibius steedae]